MEVTTQLQPRTFEDFYRLRRDSIARTLAVTINNSSLASDAVDEAMLRAYQRWRQVREMNNPDGWVYRVGLNYARDRLRKRKRERLQDVPEVGIDPTPLGDPVVAKAIEELPMSYRAVVVLRYYADWSLADIAEALEVPLGTVKSRLNRAHTNLKNALEVSS